jgi:hypothetical protein
MSMHTYSESRKRRPREPRPAEPRLDPTPHIYAGLMVNRSRITRAMKAWVRHTYRSVHRRRYRPTPVISSEPVDVRA